MGSLFRGCSWGWFGGWIRVWSSGLSLFWKRSLSKMLGVCCFLSFIWSTIMLSDYLCLLVLFFYLKRSRINLIYSSILFILSSCIEHTFDSSVRYELLLAWRIFAPSSLVCDFFMFCKAGYGYKSSPISWLASLSIKLDLLLFKRSSSYLGLSYWDARQVYHHPVSLSTLIRTALRSGERLGSEHAAIGER